MMMPMAIAITCLAVVLLNLVHWICTRRGGLLPSPTGVLGLVLAVWFWAAMVASLAALMQWMSAQVAMSCLLAWAIAKTLCAVWVRGQGTTTFSCEQAGLIITPVPALVAVLLDLEQKKGSALTEAEVVAARDAADCIAMPRDVHAKVVNARGYVDIDPENVWVDWLAFKSGKESGSG